MTETQVTKHAQTRSRLAALRARCEQERAALEIVGRAHTPVEKARLELLAQALSAFDAASAASVFAEKLEDGIDGACGRLDGPLDSLIGSWHGTSGDEDAAYLAGHAEARTRRALEDLAAFSAAIAPVKLPQV